MNILHTVASLESNQGGPARSVPQLALAQARAGHQVSVWAADGEPRRGLADGLSFEGRVNMTSRDLRPLISSGEFDLLHDHGIWLPFHHRIAVLCRRHFLPRVISPRGMLSAWALDYKKWRKRTAWCIYQRRDLLHANLLHATADEEVEQIRRAGFAGSVVVAPNGVGIDEAPCATGQSSGTRTLLYLGRVHEQKGLLALAHAWAAAAPTGWQMRIVGPAQPSFTQRLRVELDVLGVADQWQFLPETHGEAKWALLGSADAVVMPSFSENFGVVVAEALACARPVIATHGTPWQRLPAEGCGWWVSHEELAATLSEVFRCSTERLNDMGQAGQRWARREFTWAAAADTLLQSYERLLKGHPNQ